METLDLRKNKEEDNNDNKNESTTKPDKESGE